MLLPALISPGSPSLDVSKTIRDPPTLPHLGTPMPRYALVEKTPAGLLSR